jgi:hypothetical protein
MVKYFGLSLLLSGLVMIGIVPQHPPILLKALLVEDNFQFLDFQNRVIEPLMVKNTVFSDSEVCTSCKMCLVKSTGAETLALTYIDGHIVCVWGKMWVTQPIVQKIKGVSISVSGYETCNSLVYDCREKQDPHSEGQQKAVIIREPPIYLPPKRIGI